MTETGIIDEPRVQAEQVLLSAINEWGTRRDLLKQLLFDETFVEERWVIIASIKEIDDIERLLFEHFSPMLAQA